MDAVELTDSWKIAFPADLLERYNFAETRNASSNLAASHPDLHEDVVAVLTEFYIDVDRIVRPGGSKHLIPVELDEAFRELGWREARYHQRLTTELQIQPYLAAGERGVTVRRTENEYGGHKIDNVKGRVGLDVEWNPKDGNLDRDFANFRALYEAGAIDVGIIITRMEAGMRPLWTSTIEVAKTLNASEAFPEEWRERLSKTPDDPLGTSTTSNFEKLMDRIQRGDGGGCPILAIAITERSYRPPDDLEAELRRLASSTAAGEGTVTVRGRMQNEPLTSPPPTEDPDEMSEDDQ